MVFPWLRSGLNSLPPAETRYFPSGEKATEHARSGKSDEAARDAEKAVEGAEGRDLEEAEEEGKSHIAEEDPEIRQ